MTSSSSSSSSAGAHIPPPLHMQVIGEEFAVAWPDGAESYFKLDFLRKHCPCASCGGEPIDLMGNYSRPTVFHTARSFQLRSWRVVGSYALQPIWEDGHDSGLYTWRYLRKLGEKAVDEQNAPEAGTTGGCCGGGGHSHDHGHDHGHSHDHDDDAHAQGGCCGGGGCSSGQDQSHSHSHEETLESAPAPRPRATPPPLPRQEPPR
ncbi:MAG TPA: DUF971 domain-containing protein [Candidatus Methylacidiphilales bacterium]|nr:DUF971 domain-containing protein [Candidatus Methylacidiphilales bacterium]